MKTLMVAVTDEQAAQIEAEGRRYGISPDAVVHRAVIDFLASAPATTEPRPLEPDGAEPRAEHSALWFVGLAGLDDPVRERLGSGGPDERRPRRADRPGYLGGRLRGHTTVGRQI